MSLYFWSRWALGALALSCVGCLSSSSGGGGACSRGDEGCECYPNGTCNDGLACYSKLCVDGDADDDTDTRSTSTDDPDGATGTDGESSDSEATDPGAGETDGAESTDETDPSTDDTDRDETDAPAPPDVDTPVGRHGQLRVQGTQMVDEQGTVVQLKGVSSMWLNWEPTGYAESLEGLRFMRDNWGLQIIRAAMGVDEDGAYLEDPVKAQRQVETIIDNAMELGVYVLVDWHDHAAELHQEQAEAFFDNLSRLYGDVPNILYEVYNEPLDVSWNAVLKPYHERIVGAIRNNDPDNIVILGTPNWSQDVDVAASSPVSGSNLMYTLHFYACTHKAELLNRASSALAAGLPLFVTEWGAAHADGGLDGIVCESDAAVWHDWMDDNYISWTAWKLDGCTDSTCLFKDRGVPVGGGWTSSDLNGHAPFVIERMQRENPGPGSTPEPGPGSACGASGSCSSGDGMDCVDDELVERDCSACALLECGVDCCESVGYFGATSRPSFALDMDLITGFEASSDAVSLEASFDLRGGAYEQVGVISFSLEGYYDLDPSFLAIVATASNPVEVSLEAEGGEAGCLYTTYDLGGLLVLESQVTCWGGFDLYSPVAIINVRLVAYSSSVEGMTVTGVSW